MGKPTGFLELRRREPEKEPAAERIGHYRDFIQPLAEPDQRAQASRCMNCGIPFCHNFCPVNNIIPDWNDLVYRGEWQEALEVLHSTNNFPEFTGHICPAPCEAACTLNFNDQPVSIKYTELAIVERGWAEGWIKPQPATRQTGFKVAVVGSGPSGLAAAQQLARVGHAVTVYEKAEQPGGLLRLGIPDFKLEKQVIDRRVAQMVAEGVVFRTGCHVGQDVAASKLLSRFDAIVLTGGSEQPRDVKVPGRELAGVHFAMTYLSQQNRVNAGDEILPHNRISAQGLNVVVIGGGDTGSDCIGTAHRQGAKSVTQLEIMPEPPAEENKLLNWPKWPVKLRTSTSQEEGGSRCFSTDTVAFLDNGAGRVGKIKVVEVQWQDGRPSPVAGSERELPADLVLIAAGFVHPVREGLLTDLGVTLDNRGNVAADTNNYRTSVDKVFAAGDMRRGQSLVVWAIREGRQAARAVDLFLTGASDLPR